TPLKLAKPLEAAGIPILGTSPDAIDLAEDRERFQKLIRKLALRQPDNGTATSEAQAVAVAEKIGYPVVIRPSYVLGGRAMQIVYDRESLDRYMRDAVKVSGANPVLIDSYLRDAIEVDVDALADKATGQPIAKFAARLMAGEALKSLGIKKTSKAKHVAVKEAVFPFARFPGVDVILGPEMRSTGEVMGLDTDFGRAFAKSQLG